MKTTPKRKRFRSTLKCGCRPTGSLVVRTTYANERTEWGYACKCGKTFVPKGKL